MSEIDSQFLLLINGFHTEYLDQLMWLISGKLVWIPFYLITLFVIYKKRGWKGALHLLVLVGVMMLMTDSDFLFDVCRACNAGGKTPHVFPANRNVCARLAEKEPGYAAVY